MKLRKLFFLFACVFVLGACTSKSENSEKSVSNAKQIILTKSVGELQRGSFVNETKLTFTDTDGKASDFVMYSTMTYYDEKDYETYLADSKDYHEKLKVDGLTFNVEGDKKNNSVTLITKYDDKLLKEDTSTDGLKLSTNTNIVIKSAEEEGFKID